MTCKPKFLIYLVIFTYDDQIIFVKEGELKAEIEGADYTKIENSVNTHIPGIDEWFNLPFYSY